MLNKIELLEELDLSLGVYYTLKQWATTSTIQIRGEIRQIEDIKTLPLFLYTDDEIREITTFIDNIKYNLPIEVKESIIKNIKVNLN